MISRSMRRKIGGSGKEISKKFRLWTDHRVQGKPKKNTKKKKKRKRKKER